MKEPNAIYQERIARVLRYIETNLDNAPSLQELSQVACFSSYHFHRIFTAMTNESVAAYVRRLLLARAASHLTYTATPVTEVAFKAGYESIDAFARAFRSSFGMLPSQYRRSGGATVNTNRLIEKEDLFYHLRAKDYPMNIQITSFPAQTVFAYRYVGPYMECHTAWEKLWGTLGAYNLLDPTVFPLSICHDDPDVTPPAKCRMDVCIPLPNGMLAEDPTVKKLLAESDITLLTVGGSGDYARMEVKGPYALLHPAYRSLYGEWLPQSGREPAQELSVEVYLNCPETVAEENLLTAVYVALLPK